MTIKIRVDLIIKDKTIELSFEEAKEIYYQLKPLFDKEDFKYFPPGVRGDSNRIGPGVYPPYSMQDSFSKGL